MSHESQQVLSFGQTKLRKIPLLDTFVLLRHDPSGTYPHMNPRLECNFASAWTSGPCVWSRSMVSPLPKHTSPVSPATLICHENNSFTL